MEEDVLVQAGAVSLLTGGMIKNQILLWISFEVFIIWTNLFPPPLDM